MLGSCLWEFTLSAIIASLALLALLTRAVGDFRDPIYAVATALALLHLWRRFPAIPSLNRAVHWLLKWSLWALALGVIRWADPPLSIGLLTLILWSFDRYAPPESGGELKPLVVGSALYTLWWTVFFRLPPAYQWLTEFSHGYSELLTSVMTRQLTLGPSAFAMDLLLIGLCVLVPLVVVPRTARWQHAVMGIVLLEAGRIIYVWAAPTLYTLIGTTIPISTTPHLDMPWLYMIFLAAVVGMLYRVSGDWTSQALRPQRRVAAASPSIVVGVVAVVLACIVAGVGSYADTPVRVLLLDKRSLDDRVPNFQRFGDASGGMFGLLPHYLRATGYRVYKQDLTPGVLDSVDVVVVINLINKLPLNERNRIWEFVDNGGGLLVLGDHTGYDAIRGPSNDLLQPCGLELNFDTAVPLRRSWVSARDYLFHPLGRSGGVDDGQVWLGASVTPGPDGEAFLVGRGAFSDPGDVNNPDRAYLGNLEYDAGEPLGDVALAAAATWGSGRAVIFGDTSPFQNGSIIRTHALIHRTLHWLGGGGWSQMVENWRSWVLVVLIGVVGTVVLIVTLGSRQGLATALAIPVFSIWLWSVIPGPDVTSWNAASYQLAIVDRAHGQLFDGMGWEDKSTGGLQFNLLRNGYVAYFASSPEALDEYDPALYVLFAPTRPVSNTTIDRLERYVESGGWVIVSAGWNLEPNVRELLDRFGLRLRNVPLGETGGHAFADTVRLADGYPVVGDGPGIEPIIECFGLTPARIVHRGKGGLVAIGDSQFFYNKNLEGQDDFVVMENITFIRNLMRNTAGTIAP